MPDAKTLLAGVLSLLFGVAVTLVLVLTPVFVVAHVWGWVLRSQASADLHGRAPFSHAAMDGLADQHHVVDLAGHSRGDHVGHLPVVVGHPTPGAGGQERHSQVAVKALGWAAFITLLLALAMFAVPAVVAWLSSSHSGALQTILDDLGFGAGARWTPAAIGGFVAAVMAVSQSARKTLAKYNLLKTPEAAQGSTPKPGVVGTAIGYLRGLVLPWLASMLVVLAFAVAGLRWVKDGAAAGFTRGAAVAGHRRARGHAGHAFPGRRQPDIAARLLPVAAGHRLLGTAGTRLSTAVSQRRSVRRISPGHSCRS